MSYNDVLQLVDRQNSADARVREPAERDFLALSERDPSAVCSHLIQAALHESQVSVRQSCLLHIKRLVPKFWSLAFDSFVGPPVHQAAKLQIRDSLLTLATTSPELKIRSGAAYCILQIAASDFPDEWPELFPRLYEAATSTELETLVIGSLAVLEELLDDLVTEDQFWEGGVGATLLQQISRVLALPLLLNTVRLLALKLYQSVFRTLASGEASELPARQHAVKGHVVEFADLIVRLFSESRTGNSDDLLIDLTILDYRTQMYKAFQHIFGQYRRLVPSNTVEAFLRLAVADLAPATAAHTEIVVEGREQRVVGARDDLLDAALTVTLRLNENLSTLALLSYYHHLNKTFSADECAAVAELLVRGAVLPKENVDTFAADFNEYVTHISGLSVAASVREVIFEFFSAMNADDAQWLSRELGNDFQRQRYSSAPLLEEALLLCLECLFGNDDLDVEHLPAPTFVERIQLILASASDSPLVAGRALLGLPHFYEKWHIAAENGPFSSSAALQQFAQTFEAAAAIDTDQAELVQASALVAVPLWRNAGLFETLKVGSRIQTAVFRLAAALLEDSDEDTPPVLLEAISVAVDFGRDSLFLANLPNNSTVIDLVFQISFKDPANVQLTIDSADCIKALLKNVTEQEYRFICEKLMPGLMTIILNSVDSGPVEYTPELYLAFELLGEIIGAAPENAGSGDSFPPDVFLYIFPILRRLLLNSSDDQILQSGGEVFSNLLQRASNSFIKYEDPETKQPGLSLLLEMASKFLSPELSDSAAMNCGSIVISLFENFQSYLDGTFYFELLKATVRRLVIAKEVVTIENLIMVFCKLVLSTSPELVISALTSVELSDAQGNAKNGLQLVLPIWFTAFEVTRGFEQIKQNILALGKIFYLNDPSVANLITDGDLIPYDGDKIITRSMSKSMPERYTQIPAPLKIIKLLVAELGFQSQQPDPNDYIPAENDDDNGGDEWEDMDTIGVPNYDKLKSYVESDDEDQGTADLSIRDMLVLFFKECAGKNAGNFEQYYGLLDDDEKRVITENVVFGQ